MGLGPPNQPERYFGARVNSSRYGMPLPWCMGTVQVQQSVFWIDGFQSTPAPQQGKGTGGGGGKGGGKGNGQYLYSADVVVGLCNGPILGIGDVWSGQSWLGSPNVSEQYTIGGSYTYTPNNASTYYNDLGVNVQNSYSASYSDYGSPSGTTLSGTDTAPLVKVPYGTTLTTGLYSINPSGNIYNFSSADAGRTVNIPYSYLVTSILRQETDIIPAGHTITVTGGTGTGVNGDFGVVYTNTGVSLIHVVGSPSVGQYYITYSGVNNLNATYHFAAADINAEVTITYSITDPNAISPGQARSLNYTLNVGNLGQSPYAFLTSDYPDAAFGYTGAATLLYQPMDLGFSAQVQENRFEVITADAFGGGIQDCNPVQCLGQLLTNTVCGLGVGTIPFPTACIDNGPSGTWGSAAFTPGNRSVSGQAWNWFAAQNMFISPCIDGQDTAASVASKWLEAGMCAAFYSEGLLKLVPYGDTSAAANGYTWTAPANYIIPLDDTSFTQSKDGEDPVKISRVSTHDAWNVVQVQWNNRLNQYSPQITQEFDQGLINRWGERREDPQNWDFIHTVPAATFAANMRIKHNGYIRNTYVFTLPYNYSYLEPMDICPISTTSTWAGGLNNLNLGITNLPVRITKIVDDPVKGLEITAEDYPWGAHQPTLYNKQTNTAVTVANQYADPGNSEVVLFEATNRLTGFDGDQIWIGALGTSKNWGSCNIWVSQSSGGDYQCVGSIKNPSRLGILDSTFGKTLSGSPPAYDPDSADTLVVDLVENCGMLEAGSTTDADFGNTMCFVDGEIISYSALTYTGQNQITCGTYIRRGQYGSTISSHPANSLFLRLDSTVFKYTYDPTWRGQTIYLKFQSVNNFGVMSQDLSTLTPVSFTLPGVNVGTIDAATGLIIDGGTAYSIATLATLNAYNSSTAYTPGTEVTYLGNTYKCILATTGNAPTNTTYWTLMGPDNLGNLVDGSSNFSATASTLTYRPTTNPLTGHDAGSNATVNIASFTMRTSSKGDISVSSGSVTVLSYSTLYYIYYDDPTLAGGSVTYNATTTKETAINGIGRFFVGSILTPKAGAPDTVGAGDGGVGAQLGSTSIVLFSQVTSAAYNAIDGDITTFVSISPAVSQTSYDTLTVSYPVSEYYTNLTSLTLSVRTSITGAINPANANCTYTINGGAPVTIWSTSGGANRALTTDVVSLSLPVNISTISVSFSVRDTSGFGNITGNFYEAWLTLVN